MKQIPVSPGTVIATYYSIISPCSQYLYFYVLICKYALLYQKTEKKYFFVKVKFSKFVQLADGGKHDPSKAHINREEDNSMSGRKQTIFLSQQTKSVSPTT